MADYQIARVGISFPCTVPVLPGTPQTDAPLNQRTEKCNVDAWWFVGACSICDLHLREFCTMIGDDYDAIVKEFREMGWKSIPVDAETLPWAEQHRYEQTA